MRRSAQALLRSGARAAGATSSAAAACETNAMLRALPQLAQQQMATGFASTHGTFAGGQIRSFASDSDDLDADFGILYPPTSARVGAPAPKFSTGAVVDGEIKQVSLDDYKGKYVLLFFYPKDFTFVCPTEIIAFSDRAKEFEKLNCQVIAASTDTEECHLAWIRTPRNRGGLGYMQIPILADVTKDISARYGVLIEKLGIALRGLFIINPQGVIQQIVVNDLPIGRSVDEALRSLQAIQFHAEHGEVCPANWKPGEKTMIADAEKSLEYFKDVKDQAIEEFGVKMTSIKSKAHYNELISSGKPLVVDFYAPWCGKCRMLAPFMDSLVDKYPSVTFAKFDTTAPELEALAGELGIKALPALHFFKGGKTAAEPITGYKKVPLEEVVKKLA